MGQYLIKEGFIPLDKSWIIRMGILDLINGYNDTINYLEKHSKDLGDDLKALLKVPKQGNSNKPLEEGESGTLYRFLKFASWKLKKDKKFILEGTLKNRKICDNSKIINYLTNELLKIDNGTSQWASASVLLGNLERISNPPYKLQTTYDAVSHWKTARKNKEVWGPKFDETILFQAEAYLRYLDNGKINFIPKQAEDYCFARAFGIITPEEGEKRWPSLKGHESNRIKEMEEALKQTEVISKDHRIVQAIAMLKGDKIKIKFPEVVNKNWPQFWRFLEYTPHNKL